MKKSKRTERLENLISRLTDDNKFILEENIRLKEEIESYRTVISAINESKKIYEDIIAEAKKEKRKYEDIVREISAIRNDYIKSANKSLKNYTKDIVRSKESNGEKLYSLVKNSVKKG